jgi:hypothetical protein
MRGDVGELAGAIPRCGDDRALAYKSRADWNLAARAGGLCFLQRAPHEACAVFVHSLHLDRFDKRPA